MSFRTRLLVTVASVALGSLAVLAFGLRGEVDTRLSADYARRVAATVSAIEVDLRLEGDEIAARLAALGRAIQRDNRFRLAAVAGIESERRYLLDYAGTAIALTGLSMLQIQDDDGRIVSSGHFRNEHGRPAPALAERLAAEPDGVLFVTVSAPDRRFMALTRSEELRLGGRRFTLVGGVALDERFLRRLARDREVAVSLQYPGLDVSSDPDLTSQLSQIGSPPGTALTGLGDWLTGQLTVPVLGADGEPPLVDEVHVSGEGDASPVRAQLADDLPPVVADPVALRRILENLIANAVDSLVEGHGTVTVSTERLEDATEGPAVRVTVADTGCGMSEAEARNIFTDFYTTKPAGTGLGLSIVRRLVLDLHGSVRVTSRPGAGTRVMVEIPAGSSGTAPARAAEKEER